MKNISIIGSGSWGTALAIHLAKKGHNVKMWSFSEDEAKLINNERKCKFLPQAIVPEEIYCTTDFKEAIEGTEMILIVTPSKFVRETIKKFKQHVTDQAIIICSKGFEEGTLYSLDEVVREELPNSKVAGLSGPSHAEEVSIGIPTALVVASKDENLLENISETFMSETLRIYKSYDIKGAELGGALKNIIAFCAGVATGLNLGDNTFAALLTRGLSEMAKLTIKMGGDASTIYGLTGLGDLIVTCMSNHSRNRRAGILIGQGKTIEEARQEIGMVIESIDNIKIAYELSKKYNVEMPIVNSVYNVLFGKLEPKEAVTKLMTRGAKFED
ncbi:MAG: NAD(P)-dependent glycerol-3-phosphate dehydrogenase [Clostridia bacterium]|nr:NAD(P)-dependent glycerol-3-phosphate dehydrogenase [Clostridia bacterium]